MNWRTDKPGGLSPRRVSAVTVLAGLVLLLVPALAYMQYQWLGQLSEAERERMQRTLRTAAAQFAVEFDTELSRALVSETRRLNQLVEELLIYGRPMKLNPEPCDVQQLWEEVISMHRGEIEKKGVVVTGDYAVRHPLIRLDVHQIRQVFLNLLRNSLVATPAGGRIIIRLLLDDRHILFKINDTGAGIHANNIGRVFDLFFTTKPKGTGLGLAICKKILQDHGGDVSIESEVGRGTTVTVRLPYKGMTEKRET